MKGRIDVVKKGPEAHLRYTSGGGGDDYTVETLRDILLDAGIKVKIPDSVLESALAFFAGAGDGAESDVIARELPPTVPQPLSVSITAAEPPEPVKALIAELFDKSILEQEGARFGWAKRGAAVGSVSHAVPGRPGLTLGREPIPAPEMQGEDCRIGENLEIKGERLIALADGVLCVTASEAQLKGCALHEWSLIGGRAEGGCFLTYRPGRRQLAPPSEREIIYAALDCGFAVDDIIAAEDIRSLIASAHESQTQLVEHPITRSSHSDIRLDMDSARLRVELKLRKAVGRGKPLVLNDIAAVIRGSGLRGLDGPRIKAEILKFWNGEPLFAAVLLKEGVPPQRGPDREMEYLAPPLDEDHLSSIRKRLELQSEQNTALGSWKVFPPELVSAMSLVRKDQTAARLGPVKQGSPGRDIDGAPIPGYPGNDPDIAVHENLRWDGENILPLIDGVMDIGVCRDGRTHLRVREHRDAPIRVTVAKDKIKAFVSTRLPAGTGAPVDPQRIRRAAKEAGVVKGLLEKDIIEVSERTQSGEIISGHVIAEGRLPLEGDARLSLTVSGDPAAAPVAVKAEECIGTVVQGEEGGWNVLGELLMDEGAAVSEGANIRREKDDKGNTRLVAEKSGHLLMDKGVLTVKHRFEHTGDVSIVTGNIRFPGEVRIDGSVLSKAVVDGGEGVEITQVVQEALVNSGADVAIGRGIKGGGKAVVRGRGNLSLAYAEEANLLITGNISTQKALMNCRVKCNGRLILSEGGKLIGGMIKLKDGLLCGEVGNQRGIETSVSFGQDYLVGNQIDQTEKEIARIQEFIEKTDKLMMELEGRGDSRRLADVRQKKVDALKMFEKKTMRLFLLREKFEMHFPSEIRITGTAWPGTTFESHGRVLTIDSPARSIRVIFNPEKGRLERKTL